MKRFLTFIIFITICHSAYSQSWTWDNDDNVQAMEDWIQNKESTTYSNKNSSKKKDKDSNKNSSPVVIRKTPTKESEYLKLQESRRRKAEQQRRIEEEFIHGKTNLKRTLRGMDYSGGLRGLSVESPDNSNQSSYGNGLRGLHEEARQESISNQNHDYSKQTSIHSSSAEYETIHSGEGFSEEYQARGFDSNYSYSESDKVTVRSDYVNADTKNHSVTSDNGKELATDRPKVAFDEYIQYLAVCDPEPIYYSGPSDAFYRRFEPEEVSFLDKVETLADRLYDEGRWKLLSSAASKLVKFTRKTISAKSAIGKQLLKIYDIVNDAADIRNFELSFIEKNLDATKKSIITEDPQHVDYRTREAKYDADQYANKYLAKKGYLPYNYEQLSYKLPDKVEEQADETALKILEKWVSTSVE